MEISVVGGLEKSIAREGHVGAQQHHGGTVAILDEQADAARPTEYRATGASLIAIILALLCFGAVMLMHGIRGEIDPLRRVMSEYANGSHGVIMTAVFYAFGLSSLALAFRLRREFDRRDTKLIPLLLALAGLGLIAAGLFEVERPLVPDTLEETIHSNASVLAFLLLITSMLLVSHACRTDSRWWAFRWTSTTLAISAAVAAMATPVTEQTGWSGAVQRLLAVSVLLWFVLTALHVRAKAFRSP
jgi:Mn2+/Fe2+ NRAMP family transporter